MSVDVHPSAVVSPGALLSEDVRIESYAVVGDGVELGRGTTVAVSLQAVSA